MTYFQTLSTPSGGKPAAPFGVPFQEIQTGECVWALDQSFQHTLQMTKTLRLFDSPWATATTTLRLDQEIKGCAGAPDQPGWLASEDKDMLHILGWVLHVVITIAIGILGFSWEPREESDGLIKKPHEPAPKERTYSIPSRVSAPAMPLILQQEAPLRTALATARRCNPAPSLQ